MLYGSKLHIPPTIYHLLAAQQEPYKKTTTINKKYLSFLEKSQKNDKTERARGLGRKKKRGDRKGKSNDSLEIPDRRETDIPGLPSRDVSGWQRQ